MKALIEWMVGEFMMIFLPVVGFVITYGLIKLIFGENLVIGFVLFIIFLKIYKSLKKGMK